MGFYLLKRAHIWFYILPVHIIAIMMLNMYNKLKLLLLYLKPKYHSQVKIKIKSEANKRNSLRKIKKKIKEDMMRYGHVLSHHVLLVTLPPPPPIDPLIDQPHVHVLPPPA